MSMPLIAGCFVAAGALQRSLKQARQADPQIHREGQDRGAPIPELFPLSPTVGMLVGASD